MTDKHALNSTTCVVSEIFGKEQWKGLCDKLDT